MEISNEVIQKIKSKINIAKVLGTTKQIIKCPFCGFESFHIADDKQLFNCYHCGLNGDIVSLFRYKKHISAADAVALLAKHVKVEMPDYNAEWTKKQERIYKLNREAALYFHKALYAPIGKEALRYLQDRGLSDKTIKHFGLGYAPAGNESFNFIRYLEQKGFTAHEIIESDVGNSSKRGFVYSKFMDRVMFPIMNEQKQIVAFGGRVMGDAKPKYLNSAETIVFSKRNLLYAMNFVKNDQVILVEGYMDVIALHQAGFTNAVASLGTSLTAEQASLIGERFKEAVICYDADEAGQRATERALQMFGNIPVTVKTLTVPDGKDPDEFIKANGSKAFAELLKKADKFRLPVCKDKVEYLTQVAEYLSQLDDNDAKELISRIRL